ncbi:universal stress protein [Dactylosporangium sp. NPDC005555]|uniref:universal stress protein n=1 Tax=Dactylosporangium sp. NPDC005555 TaxID=3154889 RepID=UPI0033B3F146
MNLPSIEPGSVVVGVGGAPGSALAVRWAAADAGRRDRRLYLLHAEFDWQQFAYPRQFTGQVENDSYLQQARQVSQQVLVEATEQALEVRPDLRVTNVTALQPAVPALLDAARQAALIVVGSHGVGGFGALLVGSTVTQLAAHADCPVLVVRGLLPPGSRGGRDGPNAGRVVVGIDGSRSGEDALAFGFEQAAACEAGLTVVHVHRHPEAGEPGDTTPPGDDPDDLHHADRCVLAGSLAGWRKRYPGVDTRFETVSGRVSRALIDASAGAQVLAVGAHGRGGLSRLILGSVSRALVHHAICPVAVVHQASRSITASRGP